MLRFDVQYDELTTWIVTFHDNTLGVTATSATSWRLTFAATHRDAIARVRAAD